jgi:hypothetical protein
MRVGMYLDEGGHVGIDDQPFYYGGMLNVFRMRSNVARMELSGGTSLEDGKATFSKVYERLRAQGGGTISIYYHPNEWVQTEFWDAVNFSRGANPERAAWKRPGTRPAEETEQAFGDFEQYVRFMKSQPGVQFVTAPQLMTIYADRARTRSFGPQDLVGLARSVQKEITFQRLEGYTLSAADVFALLTEATASFIERNEWPSGIPVSVLDGPTRTHVPSPGAHSTSFRWHAFARAVLDTSQYCRAYRRIPDEIWVGAESLSPADYLATLAAAIEDALVSGRTPDDVARRAGSYTAERYVAADSPALWNWPIYPEGFHAPRIMELARLQAWTLKPAYFR